MSGERVSASQRITVSHLAEIEIMRYKDDHALWHKHVHGVDLDPMQVLKCIEMDMHPNTIDVSCRRTGKTAVKEMHALKHNACNPFQEVGIVAPRQQQAQTNLTYHIDAIRRSPILSAYIAYKSGRQQLSDTKYQLYNQSKGIAYGIMSQIDGDGLSYASLEEMDDMPAERLYSNFFPMLGSARRLGVASDVSFKPQIRITGVFKGADTLQGFIDSGAYHLLPIVNMYLGIELGILNESYCTQKRTEMPEGEFIRQYLCRNVAAQNHIWEKYIRLAITIGIKANLVPAGPMPGERYKKRGLISFGYDHSGHGESMTASKSALVVCEQMGNFVTFPYVKTWPAGTDDNVVRHDLVGLWRYFNPDYAMGDAFGVGMLTSVNDDLYREGLTHIDRRTIGDGDSNASTWTEWAFSPIRFEGMTKHSMASSLRAVFHNRQAAISSFDDDADALNGSSNNGSTEPNPKWVNESRKVSADTADWKLFVRQLGNMKAVPNKSGSYSSYKQVDPKVGDDLFDAACAGVWALSTRGAEHVPVIISGRTQTREQLLGVANGR